MISVDTSREIYSSLSREQQLKLALFSDFGDKAPEIYKYLMSDNDEDDKTVCQKSSSKPAQRADGVYYIYEDDTVEMFDYEKRNEPTKTVKRIGVVMGSHSLAVNLNDLPEQKLVNKEDAGNYDGYINKYDDAVADWNGQSNTEHIKAVGTDIELNDGEWIPSVAELYLVYLNKRAINVAIELSGGSRIKDGWYWTSTEGSAAHAWGLGLYDGSLYYWYAKVSDLGYVRAVAAFH